MALACACVTLNDKPLQVFAEVELAGACVRRYSVNELKQVELTGYHFASFTLLGTPGGMPGFSLSASAAA